VLPSWAVGVLLRGSTYRVREGVRNSPGQTGCGGSCEAPASSGCQQHMALPRDRGLTITAIAGRAPTDHHHQW